MANVEQEFIEGQQALDGLIKHLANKFTQKFEKLNLFGKEFIADTGSFSALDDIDFDDRHLLFPEEFLKPGPGSPVPDLWVDDYKVVYDIDVRDVSQVLREDLRLLVRLVTEDVFIGDTDVLEKTIVEGFRIDIVDTESAAGTITGFGYTRTTDKPMLVIEMNPILGPEDNFLIQEGTFVANPYIEEFYPQNRSTRLAVLKGEIPLINTQEGNYEKKIDMLKFHTTENPSIGPKQKADMLRMLEIHKNEELGLSAEIPAESQIDKATNLIDIEDTPEGVASDIVPDDISKLDTPTNVVDDIPDNIQKLIDEGKVIKTKTGNSTFKTLNRPTLLIDDKNISTNTYKELMNFADKNNYTLVVALERITEDSGYVTSEPGPMNKDELYKFWTRNGNEYFNWDLTYDNKNGIEKLWNDDKYVLEFYEPNQQAVIKFQDEIRNKYPELEQNRKAFTLEMYPYKTYDTNGNPVLMLREINVKPEFQGKGIGTKIMNELIEFADKLNIPILLSTSPTGKETLPEFYNRFGFIETGETGRNFENEKFMIRQPNELAGKVARIGEVGGTEYKSYEEALEAVKNTDTPTNVVDDIPNNIQKLIDEGKVIQTKTSSFAFDEANQNTLVIDKSTVTSKEYKELKKFADEFEYMLIKPYKVTNQSTGVKTTNFDLMKSEYLDTYNVELEKLIPGNGYSLAIYTPHQDQVQNLVSDIFDEYSQYFDKRFELEMYPYKGTEFTDGKSVMLLKQIYIKPEFQGQGIGSEIINKVTNFADELNIPIMLSTDPEQKLVDTLPDYYARFGFLDTGEVVKRTGNKERWLIRQPGELAGKIVEYGEVADDFKTYEEALQAARNTDKPLYPDYIIKQITDRGQTVPGLDTPTNVVDDSPLLETRMKINSDSNIPRERGIVRWADDVITPNKVFNPDSFTRIQEQGFRVWTKTTEFNYEEMYKRLLNNTATDEDITKFFIFTAGYSPTKAFAYKSFQDADARADIVKIGIFSDKPIIEIIPMGDQFNERQFLANLLSRNPQIKQEDITRLLVQLVNEQGQFANLKERMRNVLINAHKEIYKNNPNDYFILWRGGNLNRFYPWQSFSKKLGSAWTVANQMNQVYSGGSSVNSFIINKNNMIDLDALGLSHMDEQEVIVLTEEAKSQYAQRAKNIELAKDIDNINDWWLEARQTDAFTKQGQNITNISAPIADAGQSTQDWFNTVLQGIDERYRPKKPYEQIIDLDNPKFYKWQDDYNKLVVEGGNFNQHIFTSIPTFYETQIVKGLALSNLIDTLPNVTATGRTPDGQVNYFTILDIGGTEGTWAKALAKNNPNIDVTVLDPLQSARDTFENGEYVSNARYEQKAFSYLPEDADRFFKETGQAPVRFETFNSNFRYNVVHESMAFQFIDSNRVEQIKFIKENVLAEDGILIIEEKFLNTDLIYKANEQLKNEFKSQYYTQEQLNNKKLEVLLSMENNQVSVQEIEKILGENFANVQQYWDSGNFKGYIASDSDVVNQFVPEINNLEVSLTDHRFSTNPTNNEIRAAVQNKMQQHGTDSKLAAQIAQETIEQSPQYFNKLSKIAARFGVVGGTALAGLAKLAPALAPGDYAIEKAIEKAVPYLDDAAARLGFARIPFKNLLPTYMAYEIGVAGADIIQAAMYAYDKAQQLPKPSAAAFGSDTFQESLTRLLLPKAYEEEAIKRSQVPGDLLAFYQTPTGKRIVEEMKFGNQFMKELDQEKISKYSPGWGLTKGLLSILGELAQYEAPEVTLNSSDYTTKLKENPAMIYNAGITGSNK